MENIQKIHEELYNFLINQRNKNRRLTFTLRKGNQGNRLEDGFWFYGNRNYLAVSFWRGMDWKARIPNISFVVTLSKRCYLEINFSDSDMKKDFVQNWILPEFNLLDTGEVCVRKIYSEQADDFIQVMESFLEGDKRIIDTLINNFIVTSGYKLETIENTIGFIDTKEFNERNRKIKKYRELREKFTNPEDEFWVKEYRPSKLFSIRMKNFGPLKDVLIDLGSKKNNWVVFTGPNGSGKTVLLRALATFFGHRKLKQTDFENYGDFFALGDFVFKNEMSGFRRVRNQFIDQGFNELDDVGNKRRPFLQGFAAYGPYRLDVVSERISRQTFVKKLTKKGSFESLFSTGHPLLSLNKQLEYWRKGSKRDKEFFEKRKYYIISLLTEVIPNLIDVQFYFENNDSHTSFIFQEDVDGEKLSVAWHDLSSGIRNMIALIGDILIRMYDQQKEIIDPAELRGIVLIDEIDLHLHPQAQKDLVVNLTKVFPNIQFIVSTHSPIPLLGVPKETIVYATSFSRDQGIQIQRVDDKIYLDELLPNSILTSPIFGMKDITSSNRRFDTPVRSETTFEEIQRVDELEQSIEQFVNNSLEKELIERFESRRK